MLHNAKAIAARPPAPVAEPAASVDLDAVQRAVEAALKPLSDRLDELEQRINAALDEPKGKKRGSK